MAQRKILIVDDSVANLQLLGETLEADYDVQFARSGAEALRLLESSLPDLFILDVMMEMPDDGMAMAQELRRNGFQKPILMLTSISKVSGLEYGRDNDVVPVDEFQEKPVDPAVLIAKVARLLEGRKGASC